MRVIIEYMGVIILMYGIKDSALNAAVIKDHALNGAVLHFVAELHFVAGTRWVLINDPRDSTTGNCDTISRSSTSAASICVEIEFNISCFNEGIDFNTSISSNSLVY